MYKHAKETDEVLAFLIKAVGKEFQRTPTNLKFIRDRISEGGTVEKCKAIILMKKKEWLGDEKMDKHLKPATLFNKTRFWEYHSDLSTVVVESAAQVMQREFVAKDRQSCDPRIYKACKELMGKRLSGEITSFELSEAMFELDNKYRGVGFGLLRNISYCISNRFFFIISLI